MHHSNTFSEQFCYVYMCVHIKCNMSYTWHVTLLICVWWQQCCWDVSRCKLGGSVMAAFLLLTLNAFSSSCPVLLSSLSIPSFSPPSSVLLLSPFRAGLQMSGFPKVSSLALYVCTLLLLPVVTVVVVLVIESLTGRCLSANMHAFLSL